MWTNLVVTAYCACKLCCGPQAKGITACGVKPIEGTTIAASRAVPFNTKVYLPQIGWRVVQDRLAKRFDNRIDVYFKSHSEAKKFGKKNISVWITKNQQ